MKKWECTVCGYIHEGDEPPDECPLCSADKSMFVEVVEKQNEEQKTEKEESVVQESVALAEPSQPTPLARIYGAASEQILRHHLHPIIVHTPNGILPMALIFFLIAALFGLPHFETAALYSCIFVLISMPAVIFTGYEVWQKRYRGAMTSTFKIKIASSVVTVSLLCVLILWRILQPEILTSASTGRWLYIALSVVLVGAVGLAGHVGGKLVFGARKN